MSMMSYNGINLGDVRTADYRVENVYDDSGLDVLWQRISITVAAVVNLELCASNKASASDVSDPNAADPAGVPGDRMAISLERLRHTLSQPMKRLLYRVGNDLVLDSPVPLPSGAVPLRDCDFGPKPDASFLSVVQVVGDVTAFVQFRVTTCVNDCSNYVVSNRWRMSHSLNEFGYTTRTTTGTAILRADLMSLVGDMNADSFRREFFVPADAPLQRIDLDANLDEGGTRLTYTLTDAETTYTITSAGVVKVEGNVTAGSEMYHKSEVGLVKGLLKSAVSPLAVLGETIEMFTPRGRATFLVRVYGRRDTKRRDLYSVALKIASDRFSGAFKDGAPGGRYPLASMYATLPIGSMEEPYVELRGELFLMNLAASAVINAELFAEKILNFSSTFAQGLNWSPTASPTPKIGGDNNAVGFLKQVLAYQPVKVDPCELPGKPADVVNYFETADKLA